MLTFEFENPSSSTCECCGGITTRLTRFVYRDDDAYAIYYAMFSDDHSDRIVKMVISLGEWGEDSDPNQRRAFALDLRVTDERYEVMVTDASNCPWHKATVLGRILDHEEALRDPCIKEVFHITDHVLMEDEALKMYLDAKCS
jgi:hypothetical protein